MDRCCVHALLGLAVSVAVIAGGCQAPAEPAGPTVERVAVGSLEDRDRLWEAVGDTLRAHFFRLDRQDRVNGVITTMPETTAQTIEFWRPQPQPAYYWLDANLHTIRAQATVNLPPASAEAIPETAQPIEVLVERYRYRLPERQIDNPAAAMRVFSADAPTVAGGRMERPSMTGRWIPLGRDEAMERALLADILRRFSLPGPGAALEPDQ